MPVRSFSRISILLCLFLGSAFFAQSQNINGNFQFQTWNRTYIIHLPSNYSPGSSLPLLIGLHGLGDNASNFMLGTGLNSTSNLNDFIVVYPDGIDLGFGRAWNNGTPLNANVDDIGFISALIDTMSANYNIDLDRVYGCGFSMGGIMCHRLGCELGNKFAAVASIAGTMATSVLNSCSPCRSFSFMQMHGTADQTVPWAGNPTFGLSSVEVSISQWTGNNQCGSPDTVALPDLANDGYTMETIHYQNCADATEVLLYKITGADHVWYNGTNDVNASTEVWNFVSRFSLGSCPTEVSPSAINPFSLTCSPNPFHESLRLDWDGAKILRLELFNTMGQKIEGFEAPNGVSGSIEMDTHQFPAGLYFLRIESSTGILMQQVLKQ